MMTITTTITMIMKATMTITTTITMNMTTITTMRHIIMTMTTTIIMITATAIIITITVMKATITQMKSSQAGVWSRLENIKKRPYQPYLKPWPMRIPKTTVLFSGQKVLFPVKMEDGFTSIWFPVNRKFATAQQIIPEESVL